MTVEQLVQLIVNNGSAVALLIYFIYKDNKFTDSINKSLNAINESLNIIKDNMVTRKDTKSIVVSADESADTDS